MIYDEGVEAWQRFEENISIYVFVRVIWFWMNVKCKEACLLTERLQAHQFKLTWMKTQKINRWDAQQFRIDRSIV